MNLAGDPLSIFHLDSNVGALLKRKSGKSMFDIDEKVKVVHFNVGSGYVSYLEEDEPGGVPQVKGILLDKGKGPKGKE